MKQFIAESKSRLENRKHSQAQVQPTDLSHDSVSLTSKASVTHAQGVSSVDTGASQVLHVHLQDSMEQWQEAWVPKHVLCLCQVKISHQLQIKRAPQAPNQKSLVEELQVWEHSNLEGRDFLLGTWH